MRRETTTSPQAVPSSEGGELDGAREHRVQNSRFWSHSRSGLEPWTLNFAG